MHAVIVVGGGIAALRACLAIGLAWGGMSGLVNGAAIFTLLWLLGAAFSMWRGVHGAGDAVAEDLPNLPRHLRRAVGGGRGVVMDAGSRACR